MAENETVEPDHRACLMCGRNCAIVRKVGPLTIKEPCPNKCSAGYMKPQREQQELKG